MKLGRHAALWISCALLCYLITPIFLNRTQVEERSRAELASIKERLGAETARGVGQVGRQLYQWAMQNSGASAVLRERTRARRAVQLRRDEFMGAFAGLAEQADDYLETLLANTQAALIRLAIILAWTPWISPFVIAAILDGVIRHRINQHSPAQPSAMAHAVALHSTVVTVALSALYLIGILPIALLSVPLWGVGLSGCAWGVLGNRPAAA